MKDADRCTVDAVAVVQVVHQHIHARGDAIDDIGIGGEFGDAVMAEIEC